MITILVADDHPLVIQGLRAVIAGTDDLTVIAEASNGRDAVQQAIDHQPDVAILDLDMPELHGLQATKQIRDQCPPTVVLVLTMFDDDDTVLAALQAGAAGYLLKGADGTHVLTAIRSAAAGNTVLSPQLIDGLTDRVSSPPSPDSGLFPELTTRETDILAQLAGGLTNAQIGEQLHLSAKTIANNVSMILTKLQVTQRGQAIVLARDAGLLPGPPDDRE
jgi:DNA-binding NarL/FixJ family response regulator